MEVSIEELKKAIKDMHNCQALWKGSVYVKETFQDQTVWKGTVQVFELKDHPAAKKCYAWSHLVDESEKRKFITVLHQGPVDSPVKAVRAAIVADNK